MKQISNIEKTPSLRTVDRALALIEFVARVEHHPTVKEMSAALGLNLTTCYHLANTLEARGYLVKTRQRRWRVGPTVAGLYQAFLRDAQPAVDFTPALRRLAETTGETAYLSTWERGETVLQSVVEGPHPVRVTGLYVGLRGDSHCRASGKAVLAYLPKDELDSFLRRRRLAARTPNTVTDVRRLRAELEETARRGYALDNEEFSLGVACVAAPYFAPDGRVCGAVTVSAPVSRFAQSQADFIEETVAAGEEVSGLLGWARAQLPGAGVIEAGGTSRAKGTS